MEIREVSIKKLKPAKYNPRKDLQPDDPEYQRLKKSMIEFGDVDPIVWNEATGNIVSGHQRYKIYQEMGHDKCMVSVVNLTEKAEAVLNIALNKISGEWDYPKLKDIIAEIDTGEFDIELTGFDAEELNKMFDYNIPVNENEDSSPKLSEIYNYNIVVECDSEHHQIELIEHLEKKGVRCRSLIS
jgi:ParB-like chromosome segregation protein Spo0J